MRWLTGVLVGIAITLPAFASIKDYPFRLDTPAEGRDHSLVAINNGPAVITVSARIKGSNVASDRDWPFIDTILPHSTKKLARVFAAAPNDGYKFNVRYSHGFGSVKAAPDAEFAYRLPLGNGARSTVGQAPGGEISTHTGADSEYAIDFTVPENSPVVAARDGVVIDVTDSYTRGGEDPALLDKANVVTVLHVDGSMASYVHIAPHSAHVTVGDHVTAGQLLAHSGNTGFSSGPHLHFAVSKATVRKNGIVANESLPITFYAYKPPLRFQALQNMVLVVDYEHSGATVVPAPLLVSNSGKKALPPVETDLADPDSLILEARHDAKYWFDEVERRTGFPYWAWIGALVCLFVVLALLMELTATFRKSDAFESHLN